MSEKFQNWYRWVFLIAVIHNFLGALVLVFWHKQIYTSYGLEVPGVHYWEWIGLIFVFGVAAYFIYRDLLRSKDLVIICLLGKVASVWPIAYALAFAPTTVPATFIIPVITDSLLGLLFLVFYIHATKVHFWQSA